MKTILLVTLSIFFSLHLFAQTQMLPEVTVGKDILNGHIILIDMKDSLLITGDESIELENEIGEVQKNKLLTSFLMTEDSSELLRNYIEESTEKPITSKIIERYRSIREKQTPAKLLN